MPLDDEMMVPISPTAAKAAPFQETPYSFSPVGDVLIVYVTVSGDVTISPLSPTATYREPDQVKSFMFVPKLAR